MKIQISKTDMSFQTIDNVVQLDLSYLGNLDDGYGKDDKYNFVRVITKSKQGIKVAHQIELKDIVQFVVLEAKK